MTLKFKYYYNVKLNNILFFYQFQINYVNTYHLFVGSTSPKQKHNIVVRNKNKPIGKKIDNKYIKKNLPKILSNDGTPVDIKSWLLNKDGLAPVICRILEHCELVFLKLVAMFQFSSKQRRKKKVIDLTTDVLLTFSFWVN